MELVEEELSLEVLLRPAHHARAFWRRQRVKLRAVSHLYERQAPDAPVESAGPMEQPEIPDLASVAQAFEALAPNVWRVLQRMGVPTRQLEDATQDVFLIAHQRWSSFRGDSPRKTWILGIALRVAANQRRRSRRPADDPGLDFKDVELQPAYEASSPFELTSRREAQHELQELLAELEEEPRALVVLVHCEDLSICDAALALGMSARRAYGLLERAELKMRKTLERRKARDEWKLR
ncbi:MAG TPA: RNA polymerase sigma factor [Polyangiaceae bacterium]|nr:RNA polymerase sigma factor [Polyangiaceae bacterium]